MKSAIPFFPGALLNSFSERRWPLPRQVPKNLTRLTSSVPSSVMPALERCPFGGLTRTPSRRRMPLGFPSAQAKRSPLTPTTVPWLAILPLHRGERLAAHDGLVREHRAEPVETDGPRATNDVDRDGPVRRELDSSLVGRSREELSRLRRRGSGEQGRRESGDRGGHQEAKHGAVEGT